MKISKNVHKISFNNSKLDKGKETWWNNKFIIPKHHNYSLYR